MNATATTRVHEAVPQCHFARIRWFSGGNCDGRPSSSESSPPLTLPISPTVPASESRVLIYSSAPPRLVLFAARLLSLKAVAAASASAAIIMSSFAKASLVAATGSSFASVLFVLGPFEGRAVVGLAALATAAHLLSMRIVSRTVTRIELGINADSRCPLSRVDATGEESTQSAASHALSRGVGDDTSRSGGVPRERVLHARPALQVHDPSALLFIHRPRLWRLPGGASEEVVTTTRGAVACAPSTTTFQCFLLSVSKSHGRQVPQYLFPVRGTVRSDDLVYLKTLIYGDYFRDEVRPPPDSTLIAIEGFGAFRPAQFADIHHPRHPGGSLPFTSAPIQVPGTPYTVAHGTVWAHWRLPARRGTAERRAAERDAKLYGADEVAPNTSLPTVPAPISLMLDGSHYTPTYSEVTASMAAATAHASEPLPHHSESVKAAHDVASDGRT